MFGKFTIVISVKYTLQHCQVLSINTLTRQGAMRHTPLGHYVASKEWKTQSLTKKWPYNISREKTLMGVCICWTSPLILFLTSNRNLVSGHLCRSWIKCKYNLTRLLGGGNPPCI